METELKGLEDSGSNKFDNKWTTSSCKFTEKREEMGAQEQYKGHHWKLRAAVLDNCGLANHEEDAGAGGDVTP